MRNWKVKGKLCDDGRAPMSRSGLRPGFANGFNRYKWFVLKPVSD